MKLRLALLAGALLSAAALGACGSGQSTTERAASIAPAASVIYAEAEIDPSGSQETNMRSILADLPGSGPPAERLNDLLEKASQDDPKSKVDYRKDVQPWLGDTAAGFLVPGKRGGEDIDGAVVIATTDDEAAAKVLEKEQTTARSYRGVSYGLDADKDAQGVVAGFVVFGTEAAFKAVVDASKGTSLADVDRYKKATASISDERVGFVYEDLAGLFQAFAGKGADPQLGALAPLLGRLFGSKPVVATVRAEQEALVVDGSITTLPEAFKGLSGGTPLLGEVPADSWVVLGIPDISKIVHASLGVLGGVIGEQAIAGELRKATGLDLQQDLLSWIGDAAIFVRGESEQTIGGAVVIQSKQPKASLRALTKLVAVARAEGATVSAARLPGAAGFKFTDASIPAAIYLAQKANRVVIAYGAEAARAALGGGNRLGRDAGYARAATELGSGYRPSLYLSAPHILRLAESFGAADDKDYRQARPYLNALEYLIVGSRVDGKGASRMRLGFQKSG